MKPAKLLQYVVSKRWNKVDPFCCFGDSNCTFQRECDRQMVQTSRVSVCILFFEKVDVSEKPHQLSSFVTSSTVVEVVLHSSDDDLTCCDIKLTLRVLLYSSVDWPELVETLVRQSNRVFVSLRCAPRVDTFFG